MCEETLMPYLDWTPEELEVSLIQEVSQSNSSRTQLTLKLGSKEIQSFIGELESIYGGTSRELRISLPQGWTVFWKKRDSGARALLAHPQSNEWVSTIALEADQGKQLISFLNALEIGQSFNLSQRIALDQVSNLELVIVKVLGCETLGVKSSG